jgi:hypothetical protein
MDPKGRTVEARIAEIASRQHGVVSRRELLKAGVSPTEIRRRVRRGALISIHRGVFRVGHQAPSRLARYMAAVKACGQGSLLSGRAAAHLLGLLRRPPSLPEVRCRTERRVPGVITHRTRPTEPADGISWRGIPMTSVPRTLVDLAAALGEPALARAVHEADVRHNVTPDQIEAVLARRHN